MQIPYLRISTARRANVLGVGIHAVNLQSAVELMEQAVVHRSPGYVCVTGVHGVIEAQDNPAYKQILNNSFLTVPDGRPGVWVGWSQGLAEMEQVGGPDLILRFCELSSRKGYTQFFYGGEPGVAERLRDVLAQRYPGLKVVGTYTPPFRTLTADEERDFADRLAGLKPDVMWICLGAPKQEIYMAQHLGKLPTTLMVGIGAAFDMHAGHIKDAPQWLKPFGLAWFHRLLQEPRKLGKRYVRLIPRFAWAISLQLFGLRKYSLEDNQHRMMAHAAVEVRGIHVDGR